MKKALLFLCVACCTLSFILSMPLSGLGATDKKSGKVKSWKAKKKSPARVASRKPAVKKLKAGRKGKVVARKKSPRIRTTARTIHARNLGEIQGPLPEIIRTEINKLRQAHQLLGTDDLSMHVYDLSQNETLVDIKADQIRNAASLIKPFVMLTIYDLAYQNKLVLNERMDAMIYKMITVSHNGATNQLIRLIGEGDAHKGLQRINQTLRKYEFTDTHLVEIIPDGGRTYQNRTSTLDMTEFFKKLYQHGLVSPYYSQKMTDVLLNNKVHRIETPELKLDGIPVADKTGYVRGMNGDCGIVYLKDQNRRASDYVVSIIIENPHQPEGGWGRQKTAVIRHLSNLVYNYFKQQCQAKLPQSWGSQG